MEDTFHACQGNDNWETLNPMCRYTILIFLTAQSAGSQTKILPIVKEWRNALEEVYAVVFMDAIHYHVSEWRTYCKTMRVYIVCMIWMKRCSWNRMLEKTSAEVLAFYHEWIKTEALRDILIGMRWWFQMDFAPRHWGRCLKQRFSSVSSIRSVIQCEVWTFLASTSKNCVI